jgi:hypothetical protein
MWLISAAPVNDTLHGFRTEVLWPSEDTWSEKNRNSSNLRRLSWWNRRHWQTTSELVKQNLWTKAQLMNDDCQPQAAPPSILVACTLTGNSSWAFVYRLSISTICMSVILRKSHSARLATVLITANDYRNLKKWLTLKMLADNIHATIHNHQIFILLQQAQVHISRSSWSVQWVALLEIFTLP